MLMSQPPHFDVNGVIYFVTTRLNSNIDILTDYETEIIQKTILELSNWEAKASHTQQPLENSTSGWGNSIADKSDFNRQSKMEEFILYAYVVMPDHVHILLKPISNGISKIMQLIKGRSARLINIYRKAKASPTKQQLESSTPRMENPVIGKINSKIVKDNLIIDKDDLMTVKGTLITGNDNSLKSRDDFNHPITLWQKGFFDFTILSVKKFQEKFNYIHFNPVKRRLVEKAEDYKYSSVMEYKVKYGEVFYENKARG